MRSVTLPLLMFCLGLAACSGDGGRRPSTCEVISPPDVMVPTEQNRSSGKPGGKDWTRWTCDSKAVIEWRYIDGSKNIVDLRLKDEDDVVHHLEQEPAAVGAFYSDGRLGFHLENDEGLVYWVETDDRSSQGT